MIRPGAAWEPLPTTKEEEDTVPSRAGAWMDYEWKGIPNSNTTKMGCRERRLEEDGVVEPPSRFSVPNSTRIMASLTAGTSVTDLEV